MQESVETYEPRTVDSLTIGTMREKLQRARKCYASLPVLDSLASNQYARTFGLEVQVLWETRHHEEAAALTEEFLSGPHLRTDSSGMRYMLEWRSYILDQQGEVEDAAQARIQLLDYAASEPPHIRSRIWLNVGGNYSRLGWWDDALEIYRSIQEEFGGERATQLEPELRINLARSYAKESEVLLYEKHIGDNLTRSLEAAREAVRMLSLGESSRERHHRMFAYTSLLEALRLNGQYEAALEAGRKAIEIGEQLERPSPGGVALGWEAVGRILLILDRFDEAEDAFNRSLAVLEGSGVRNYLVPVLNGLAEVAMQTGDFARADSLVDQVIHVIESERESVARATEQNRSAFWYPYYLTRVNLLLYQDRDAEAFLALDQARARVLRDLRRFRVGQLSAEDRVVADSLSAVLGELHSRLAASGLSRADRLRLRDRVNEVETKRTALYDVDEGLQEVTIPRIQAALADRDQVLISYHLDTPAHAFVLRPDTLVAVELDGSLDADRIRELMGDVSAQWNRADGPISTENASFNLGPLKTLYDLIFVPVEPYIPEGAPLVVVPEGPLAQFPFGLLLESDPGRFQFSDAPFLLHRHPVSTELAAALLLEAPLSPAENLVAFGRSEFGALRDSSQSLTAARESLPDLPSVAREMEAIADRFPSAHVALDGAATESSLYQHASGARLLHLASHALVNDSDPLSSYIQLMPDPDGREDGRVYLTELMNRPLAASLVVLSGCRTARGRNLSGEGTVGLHYAVRAAGAESSVGTLWRVDDVATVELMDRLYDHLARGTRKDIALQRAQVEYLEANEGFRASPFFWAAPVLYGDPRPVPLPSAPSSWWWIVGGALVLTAFLVPLARRRFASP